MTDDNETRSAMKTKRLTLALTALAFLIVGGVAGFIIANLTSDNGGGGRVSTPDAKTVTCGQWAGLNTDQKDQIAEDLSVDTRDDIDTACVTAGPVYSVVRALAP